MGFANIFVLTVLISAAKKHDDKASFFGIINAVARTHIDLKFKNTLSH